MLSVQADARAPKDEQNKNSNKLNGWTFPALARIFGELPRRQPGLGYGALVVGGCALALLCHGLALRGWAGGNSFVAIAIGASIALVGLFTLYPLARLFQFAFLDASGHASLAALTDRIASSRIWGMGGIV